MQWGAKGNPRLVVVCPVAESQVFTLPATCEALAGAAGDSC